MFKKIIVLFVVFAAFMLLPFASVYAAEEPVVEEPVIEEVGFFEKLGIAIFDFLGSEDFTRITSSMALIGAAIYPFFKKYLSAKAQAKYALLISKLANAKNEVQIWKDAAIEYGKHLDQERKYWSSKFNSLESALKLAFNESNLKSDVKDEINKILNAVPQIEQIDLETIYAQEKEKFLNELKLIEAKNGGALPEEGPQIQQLASTEPSSDGGGW